MAEDDVKLRALAEGVEHRFDWYGAGPGVINTKNPEDVAFIAAANPSAVLALLDRVEAAEGAVERVRVLAKFWTDADGEPATDRDLTVLNVTNRHGRELTAALDGPR